MFNVYYYNNKKNGVSSAILGVFLDEKNLTQKSPIQYIHFNDSYSYDTNKSITWLLFLKW